MNTLRAALGWRKPATPLFDTRSLLGKFVRHRGGMIGLVLALTMTLVVFIGPSLVRVDPNEIDYTRKLVAPGAEHLLGTDQYGRDQLARVLDGGRRSLGATFLVVSSLLVIGMAVGITSGMVGGVLDAMLMRVVDVLLALPSTVLALAIVGVLGPGLNNLLIAMVVASWSYYARLSRSYVLVARQRKDVISDRLAGIRWVPIVLGHIIPGVFSQLLIVATLDLGGIIISIASFSFLGLGVQPPLAEWGAMLSTSRLYFSKAPWLWAAPTAAIFLTVVGFNMIGNALRDLSGLREVG